MEQLTHQELVERINHELIVDYNVQECTVKTIQPFNKTPQGYEWDIARLGNNGRRPAETSVKKVRRIVQDLKKKVRLKPDPDTGLP